MMPTSTEPVPSLHRASSAARVVVADDDPAMRSLVSFTLRAAGHEVLELPDGGRLLVEVTRQLKQNGAIDADVFVSDIRMPVMTGLAMVTALRDAHVHVPVILMTAFPDAQTRMLAHRADARILDKPFSMQMLRDEVADVLARRRLPQA